MIALAWKKIKYFDYDLCEASQIDVRNAIVRHKAFQA